MPGEVPRGGDIPDEKFAYPGIVVQSKHKRSYVPSYVDSSVSRGIDSDVIEIPNGTPIYSTYTRALVGYWPIPCDAKIEHPNHGKFFHVVVLNQDAGVHDSNGIPKGEYHLHRTSFSGDSGYYVE